MEFFKKENNSESPQPQIMFSDNNYVKEDSNHCFEINTKRVYSDLTNLALGNKSPKVIRGVKKKLARTRRRNTVHCIDTAPASYWDSIDTVPESYWEHQNNEKSTNTINEELSRCVLLKQSLINGLYYEEKIVEISTNDEER